MRPWPVSTIRAALHRFKKTGLARPTSLVRQISNGGCPAWMLLRFRCALRSWPEKGLRIWSLRDCHWAEGSCSSKRNNGMSTMENQALQIDKKSTEMSRERTAEGKSPKRSPSDRKPLVWQMAVSKKLPSDHPCKGPFPTD